jgi:hypothetical protein
MKRMFVLLVVLVYCTMLFSQSVAGFQEYYIPGPEDDLDVIWSYVEGSYSTFRTVVSVTATTDNTEIIYDHWEDGYSDSDASNEIYTLSAGDYHKFEDETIPIPVTGMNYDGGDRIYVTGGPVFVLRAALPNPIMSICLELLPTEAWRGGSGGVDFIMPFGTDLFASDGTVFHDFESVAVIIQSASDANTITFDCPDNVNDWSGDIDRGETKYLTDIRQGTTITTDAIAQVHMIIGHDADGDPDGSRELRGLSGIPAYDGNANDYWAPIEVSNNTDIFIYNGNASSITVSYEDGTTGSFSVSAGETVSYENETGHYVSSGAHVYTANNDEFCAVMSVDTRSATRDWATVLTQSSLLGTDYRIGWAAGNSNVPPTTICNSLFAIATEDDTDLFVDFNGDGTIDQSFIGGNTLDKLDVVLIADQSDFDTSGARIWSNDKNFALSYGEIAGTNQFLGGSNTPTGSPAMDLGYTILPLPDEWLAPVIQVTASDDQGESPVTTVGENVNFTIRLDAHDYNLTSVTMSSVLDICWEYYDDSSVITYYNSSDVQQWTTSGNDADPTITGTSDPGYTLSWPIDNYDGEEDGIVNANDYVIITFDAYPTVCTLEGENEIVSETGGTYNSHEFNAYDSEFVTVDGDPGVFGDEPVPVCLGEFLISIDNSVPVLAWTTQSESNNLGWNIYRNSEDDFANAAQVNSQLIEGAGFSSIPTEYSFADNSELESGSVYWYYLEDVSYSGSTSIIASGYIHITEDIPVYNNAITGIYPNPFNPSTMISFSIEYTTEVTLSVYNNRGQKVVELLNSTLEAGEYTEEWNGTNIKGNRVSSGVYFVNLSFKGRSITKKMLLIK